jgi:peptidoglycan/LPS O-acetylase OafA/YrhL
MGKYSKYTRQKPPRSREAHPIWRGIGCILIVIVPLLSFAGAALLVNYGLSQGWSIPSEWLGNIKFPDWVWKIPFLVSIAGPIASYNNLKAVLAFFVVILVLLMGVYSTLYAIIYRGLGPPRYSALDAPPSGRKVKRYKR